MQYAVGIQNARLDAVEAWLGAGAILKLRTGAAPSGGVAAADSGTVVATLQLPSDWMQDAANGVKAKNGNWEDPVADADGTIGHYRFYKADGTTCGIQGPVSLNGAGGEFQVDNTTVKAGQDVLITAFTITSGNK